MHSFHLVWGVKKLSKGIAPERERKKLKIRSRERWFGACVIFHFHKHLFWWRLHSIDRRSSVTRGREEKRKREREEEEEVERQANKWCTLLVEWLSSSVTSVVHWWGHSREDEHAVLKLLFTQHSCERYFSRFQDAQCTTLCIKVIMQWTFTSVQGWKAQVY